MQNIAIIISLACICTSTSENCNEEVSGSYGTIVSPGYPLEPYPNNLDCFYKITTSTNKTITMEIDNMFIESGFDFLVIYDGSTNTSAIIGNYTGLLTGVCMYASTNEALVNFHTDSTGQYDGFYIYFEESDDIFCPTSEYTDDSGFIQSSYYPNAYPNNTDCYYNLKTSLNTQMIFHMHYFDAELSTNCTKDFLEIFDGPTTQYKSIAKLCGSGPFHDIISSTNQVLAHFHSDSEINGLGFNISYTTNACSGPIEYNGDFGTIYSPGYPIYKYPNFANCNYTVVTPAGSQVLLYLNYLNIEAAPEGCGYDFLRIFDGPDDTDPQLAEFCGTNSSIGIQASTNKVLLEFYSDYAVPYEGFVITFVARNFGTFVEQI